MGLRPHGPRVARNEHKRVPSHPLQEPPCLPVCSRWHPITSPFQKLSSHLGNGTWAQGSTQLLDIPFDPTTVPFRVTDRLMSNV